MADKFSNVDEVDAPSRSFMVIVPNDGVDIDVPKALYFNAAGAVSLIAADDQTNGGAGTPVVFQVDARQTLAVRARRVRATGTTLVAAGDIIGLF